MVKTRTVRRLKMSKEDYFNLVQEINKNRGKIYQKPTTQREEKRNSILYRNKTESNLKREHFNKTPQSVISHRNNSKVVMKTSALNLLMDKVKLSEFMRSTTLDVNLDSNENMNIQNLQEPSKITFTIIYNSISLFYSGVWIVQHSLQILITIKIN